MRKLLGKFKNKLGKSGKADPDRKRVASIMHILDTGLGHKLSFEEKKPVDPKGDPLPWFTYPAIEYLKQLDLRKSSVLEWGIGNSTRFFATRCKRILSIEHDRKWLDHISAELPGNAEPIFATADMYEQYPLQKPEKFDLIIVDGIRRAQCIEVALRVIADDGVIIFDNSDRNPELCAVLRNGDFIQVDFHGMGPINPYAWTTSFFFGRKSNIKPLTFQPLIPVGGGY